MKPYINFGYRWLRLSVDGASSGQRVACLVALAFHGPRPDGHHVCHRDGSRTNDRPGNLYYGTPSQNAEDKRRHGTLLEGERAPQAKITSAQVEEIRALRGTAPQSVIAARFGIAQGHVSRIQRGVNWGCVR